MTEHNSDPASPAVEAELRRKGCPVRYDERPTNRWPVRSPVESATEPASTPPSTPALSPTSPLPAGHGRAGGQGAAAGVRPPADQVAGDSAPVLFTPAQAANLLQVRESWLRRRVARRLVPCTFIGKHLRFSHANLQQIIADAARPTATTLHAGLGTGAHPHRSGQPRRRARTNSRRPNAGQRAQPSHT